MNNLDEIEVELAKVRHEIAKLNASKRWLESRRRKILSRDWIAMNGVTMDQVELSTNPHSIWFNTIGDFSAWLRENSDKPFCEWNTMILRTADVKAGKFDRDAPGRIEDVPESNERPER